MTKPLPSSRPRIRSSRPAKSDPTPPLTVAEPPPDAPRILLVDDDAAVRSSLNRALAGHGWHITCAATGAEALELLATRPPDLLITDLRMTEVNGWDLLFHEQLQRPRLAIFVITALPPSDAGGAERIATRFFQKPLDLDMLVDAIHESLAGSAATRGARPL